MREASDATNKQQLDMPHSGSSLTCLTAAYHLVIVARSNPLRLSLAARAGRSIYLDLSLHPSVSLCAISKFRRSFKSRCKGKKGKTSETTWTCSRESLKLFLYTTIPRCYNYSESRSGVRWNRTQGVRKRERGLALRVSWS